MFYEKLDQLEIRELSRMFLDDHKKVFKAISKALDSINVVIELIVNTVIKDGRVFYIGAGTSGRIAVLDASEIGPTFSRSDIFIPIIAGGIEAFFSAKEYLEDDESLGIEELKKRNFSDKDVLIGISASGTTPFVISSLKYAKSKSAKNVLIANKDVYYDFVDYHIILKTGEEFIKGSTRLKAGTSQKIVLNMISTISMIKLGYTFGNLMVSVNPTNSKLIDRAASIVSEISGISFEMAKEMILQVKDPRIALIMIKKGVSKEEAERILRENKYSFRKAYG